MGTKRRRDEEAVPSSSSSEDGQVDSDSEAEAEAVRSPPKRVRRASILPGFAAYNDAILASFEAVLLEDLSSLAHPNAGHDEDDADEGTRKETRKKRTGSSSSENSVT